MANYIVSYDLNGSTPTHKEMDAYISANVKWTRGRILETVWYIGTSDSKSVVFDYFNKILSKNDRLLVVSCSDASWRNLIVNDESFRSEWNANW
ncbi:hypothetical protein GGQ96_003147 [Sphingomonas abaci]|uniref:SinR family protein n=1 Tax=Sphingomonas abaci TaxID=237611 RepID=A0A7W7AL09_9SPHN|nr:hypothetical protein [Sphingomonas abaci]